MRVVSSLLLALLLSGPALAQDVRSHVDFDWFMSQFLDDHADLYLTATDSSTGFLYTRLNRFWQMDGPNAATDWNTTVGDSRALYTLGIAGRIAASHGNQATYQSAVTKAANFLLTEVQDPTYGGFVHGFYPDGTWYSGTWPYDNLTGKDALGHGHTMLAMTSAWQLTKDPNFLGGAYEAWNTLDTHLRDPGYAGAFIQGTSRDYSTLWPNDPRNINHMMHIFEPVMEMYAATGDPNLRAAGNEMGDFIINTMYNSISGAPNLGYWANSYDENWAPGADSFIDVGHSIEMAFLVSRAVELGLGGGNEGLWLDRAERVINLLMDVAYDNTGGEKGGWLDHRVNYDGTLQSNTWDKSHWQTLELARAMLHWASVRGRTDLWDEFDETLALLQDKFVDYDWGSLGGYGTSDLAYTDDYGRGAHWGGGYHETMFYLEALRRSVLEGDSNMDGIVDDADYTIWADNYGQSLVDWLDGDYNGDGVVDDADYTLWADNYGATTATTPEPASLGLLAATAWAVIRRRRR